MKKQWISMMLLVSMLASASCGTSGAANDTTDAAEDDSTTAAEETGFNPGLPADLDFGGEEITILWRKGQNEFAEEQNGDIVNDAMYQRDMNIEQWLNVKLRHVELDYTWNKRSDYLGTIQKGVMAGDSEYDIVSAHYSIVAPLISDGTLLNLSKLSYLDFDQPWWNKRMAEETSIDGKLYMMTGDISRASVGSVGCMFINQRMAEDYKIPDIVKTVDDGKWTLDEMFRLSNLVYEDVNGNSERDVNDIYGFVISHYNQVSPFMQSTGLSVTKKDERGLPKLALGTEKAADVYERIRTFFHESNGAYTHGEKAAEVAMQIFRDGRALLIPATFGDTVTQLSEMKDAYLPIPYPKYDGNQKAYATRFNEACDLFGVTASCKAPECAAAVMEAMASEGYRLITPAYYEVAMKVKYSTTDDTARMFDLIKGGITFDFGTVFHSVTTMTSWFRDDSYDNIAGWASTYAGIEESHQAKIDTFVAAIQALE
ncbi:MAG: extracellular solute-binding protein [Clostridia bacterium]|nr:extracellular solute-binding protein [Clostridia bacterium]